MPRITPPPTSTSDTAPSSALLHLTSPSPATIQLQRAFAVLPPSSNLTVALHSLPVHSRTKTFATASTAAATVFSAAHALSRPDIEITLWFVTTRASEAGPGPVKTLEDVRARRWDKVFGDPPAVYCDEKNEGWEEGDGEEVVGHSVVAVGGTFDHLHLGHRLLLTMTAYTLSPCCGAGERRMIVGVSGPALLKRKEYASHMEPWGTRVARVQRFLVAAISGPMEELEWGEEKVVVRIGGTIVEMVMLHEPCGPTVTDAGITALVVTEETRRGGDFVNDERKKRGLGKLEVMAVGLVNAGAGGKLSSTELRRRVANEMEDA